MVLFDANMILRYLLNDNAEMAEKADQLLQSSDVAVTTEVIAEVVYVLRGVYAAEREKIAAVVKKFLELVQCRDKAVLNVALDTYGERGLDFVDCVLFAWHKVRGAEIATFDKKLIRLMSALALDYGKSHPKA